MHATPLVRLALIDEPRLALFDDPGARLPVDPPVVQSPVGKSVVDRQQQSPVRTAILLARRHLLNEQHASGCWFAELADETALLVRLLLWWQFRDDSDQACRESIATQLRDRRLSSGGWAIAAGGEAHLSTSVLCYFALKLQDGIDALDELQSARRVINSLGGIGAADAETRAWLSLFGQIPKADSEVSSEITEAFARVQPKTISPLHGMAELLAPAEAPTENNESDRAAVAAALSPAATLVWRRLGLSDTDESTRELRENLDQQLMAISQGDRPLLADARTVRSTTRAIGALLKSGLAANHESVAAGLDWLMDEKCSIDSTRDLAQAAELLSVLAAARQSSRTGHDELPPDLRLDWACDSKTKAVTPEENRRERVETYGDRLARQLAALLTEQTDTGEDGWATSESASCELSSRVLWALAQWSRDDHIATIQRACIWLARQQLADGGWPAANDEERVKVTGLALNALMAGGKDNDDSAILAGVNWVLAQQQTAGGWIDSDQAWHTAMAVEALTAAGFATQRSVHRAADLLLDMQQETGGWQESLDATSLTLRALSAWAVGSPTSPAAGREVFLRLVSGDEGKLPTRCGVKKCGGEDA